MKRMICIINKGILQSVFILIFNHNKWSIVKFDFSEKVETIKRPLKTKSDTRLRSILKTELNEVLDADEYTPQLINSISIKTNMKPEYINN